MDKCAKVTNFMVSKALCMKSIRNSKSSENVINKRIFSKIYLGCAIFFSVLYIFVGQFKSNITGNKKIILIIVAILFDVFLYLMSFLYSNWKIEIDDEGITYQTLLKKKKKISYSNVSKVLKDEYGNLILYEDESIFIKMSKYEGYGILEKNLKVHGLKIKNISDITDFVVETTKFYYGLDLCCIVAAIFLQGFSLNYHYIVGVCFFTVLFILAVIQFLCRIFNKTQVQGTIITCYRFLRKPKKVRFSDVKYIKRKESDNAENIYLYLKDGSKIKVSSIQKNMELFEEVIKKQKWKSR